MMEIALLLIVFVASMLGTKVLRTYAIHKDLMDRPNARSSHKIPTPRGGGVSIVIVLLSLLCLWMGFSDGFGIMIPLGLWVGGLIVALIGFADDHGHIPARWRFAVHLSSGVWLLGCLGGMPSMDGLVFPLPILGLVFGVLAICWVINLYNFMDGIDGIAAVEAVTVALAGGAFLAVDGQLPLAYFCFCAAASAGGFLVINWSPARIFMGDAGSGFLGFILGAMMVICAWRSSWVFPWVILLGVFIVDATMTLLRRMVNGQKWYEAHRSHAYQHAALRWGHARVTVAVALINIFWLSPMAYWSWHQDVYRALGISAIALAPVAVLCWRFNAGRSSIPEKKIESNSGKTEPERIVDNIVDPTAETVVQQGPIKSL